MCGKKTKRSLGSGSKKIRPMENRAKKEGRENGHSSFERGPPRAVFLGRGDRKPCAQAGVGGSEDNQHTHFPKKPAREGKKETEPSLKRQVGAPVDFSRWAGLLMLIRCRAPTDRETQIQERGGRWMEKGPGGARQERSRAEGLASDVGKTAFSLR